jgi:hypothetical protein
MAQIGEVMDICLAKLQPPRHGWEHRAKALAVATSVADLQLAGDFCFSGSFSL